MNKLYLITISTILGVASVSAQTIREVHTLGGVFGTNRGSGSYSTSANTGSFDSSPTGTGNGIAWNVRELAASNGINFKPRFTSTQINLGSGLRDTKLSSYVFDRSGFNVVDIDSKDYAFNFSFKREDGSAITSLSELHINLYGGTGTFSNTSTANVFRFDTGSITGGGFSKNPPTGIFLEFTAKSGPALEQFNMSGITSTGANSSDNVRIEGFRYLKQTPEPSSTTLLGLGALGILLRRKR